MSGELEPLQFPAAPENRPYVFINMVATIDGKILSGERDEGVQDLGSKNDKAMMKHIERHADAVMLGARTLRATPKTWTPQSPIRIVVTKSGNLPLDHGFFNGGRGLVAVPEGGPTFAGCTVHIGQEAVDLQRLLCALREGIKDAKLPGISRLLVMGGSDLNAQLFALDVVDEIFLTIAPKIKLGNDVPTIADGDPLSRTELQRYHLLSHQVVEDELFLRYRRDRSR